MKKSTVCLVLLLSLTAGSAFTQILRSYGIKIAATSAVYDWEVKHPGQVVPDLRRISGINLAAYAEWVDCSFLSIVTQLEYSQRGTSIAWPALTFSNAYEKVLTYDHVYYLSMPVFAKLRPLKSDISPFILLGPRFDYLIDRRIEDTGYNVIFDHLEKVLLGYSIAVGIESSSLVGSNLSLEVRYNRDFLNSYNANGVVIHNEAIDLWLGFGL